MLMVCCGWRGSLAHQDCNKDGTVTMTEVEHWINSQEALEGFARNFARFGETTVAPIRSVIGTQLSSRPNA